MASTTLLLMSRHMKIPMLYMLLHGIIMVEWTE
jgi:hypothetical protein